MFSRNDSLNRLGVCEMYALTGGTKKGCRLVDRPPVPVDSSGIGRQQPQQDPQQRRLARANPARYDRETAPLKTQIHVDDTLLRTGKAIGQARGGEVLQRIRFYRSSVVGRR